MSKFYPDGRYRYDDPETIAAYNSYEPHGGDLCANCGGPRHLHNQWGEDLQKKYGKKCLCYCQGDGGFPGPDAGREPCNCGEFIEPVSGDR